jgi:integrase
MATVKAFVRTSTKNKNANVRFRLSDGRDIQLFHKSELTINPDVWDEKKEAIKAKILYHETDRINFNNSVNERKDLILRLYSAEANKDTLTSDWLDAAIDKSLHPEKYKLHKDLDTLLKYVAFFIEEAPSRKDKNTGRFLTYNNIQQYKATEKHLKDFATSIHKKDFSFEEIDQSFYDKFVSFLQKKQFTQNSVGKHIRVLKLMLNEATTKGINTSLYYNTFHVFTEETDTIYLNEEELQKFKDTDLSNKPHLERVRDWFLLLAWTGCRFSDLEKITKTDINDKFITFRQQKTNNKVTIPLHPVVTEILDKYNYNLPEQISNQKFNEYIKDAAQIAKINSIETTTKTIGGKLITEKFEKWKQISSHTGRRSFCTNMYKRGLQTLMIMSISGHRTEKSFLKYIKVKQSEHAEMMAKAWENMYK